MSRLGIPAYFHPSTRPEAWRHLRLRPPAAVALNVDSGPGTARDPGFAEVIPGLLAAGVAVLGYVDTAYGDRGGPEILDELRRYRAWYGVRGVFLDQVAPDLVALSWYRALVDAARLAGAGPIGLNPGVYPHPGFGDLGDVVVTFEGPWSAYRTAHTPVWPGRCWHLVYATPRHAVPRALRKATRHAGMVYVTDQAGANPWCGLPAYYEMECRFAEATA